MDQHLDARTAATDLDRIMDAVVATGETALVNRGNEPAVVILTVGQYLDLEPPHEWPAGRRAAAKQAGLATMTMGDITQEIAASRRQSRERATRPE